MDLSCWLIIALLLLTFIVGIVSSKDVNTFEKFSLSKSRFNTFTLSATIVATFVGAGTVIGNAEKAYASGIGHAMGIAGMSLHFILSGIFIAPKLARLTNILTIGDLIKKEWGQKAQISSGILWLCSCTGIVTVQIAALGKVFGLFLPFDYTINTLISAFIVIVYCSYGGIVAVVTTDVVQFIIISIALPLTFFIGLFHVGGWNAFCQALPSSHLNPLEDLNLLQFGILFLTLALGEALTPPYLQRSLMAQTAKQARNSMITAGIVIIPLALFAGALGLLTYVLNNAIYPHQTLIDLANCLPIFLKGIIVSALIAVIMSSADSFLNSGAVCFVNDILLPVSNKSPSNLKSLNWAKFGTAIMGILAAYFATSVKDILDALIYSYRFWAPTMVVPIAGLILNKVVSVFGFYISAGAGLLTLICWDIFNLTEITTVDGIIPGLFVNLIFYIIFFTKSKIVHVIRACKSYFDY